MNDQPDDLEALLHRSFRYALSLVHNQDLAQDLVQEACVKISRNNGPWHIGYIITTIRHCYIDQYHRGKHIQVEGKTYLIHLTLNWHQHYNNSGLMNVNCCISRLSKSIPPTKLPN